MNELPDLHKQAYIFKNRKRLQHDGGRAWIKDSQLYEAITGGNYRLVTMKPEGLEGAGKDVLDIHAGKTIRATDTGKKV